MPGAAGPATVTLVTGTQATDTPATGTPATPTGITRGTRAHTATPVTERTSAVTW